MCGLKIFLTMFAQNYPITYFYKSLVFSIFLKTTLNFLELLKINLNVGLL